MREERKHDRHRTARVGQIIFDQHMSAVDCRVRNFSPAGACLQVASLKGIPDTFTLRVARGNITWPCRVIWKSANRIGVSFDEEPRVASRRNGVSAA
jgi:hypothetical protein